MAIAVMVSIMAIRTCALPQLAIAQRMIGDRNAKPFSHGGRL
jgi:hypothetical protein